MISFIKLFISGLPLEKIKNFALIATIIFALLMSLLWQLEKTRHRLTTSEFDAFKRELQVQVENNEQRLAMQAKFANENIAKIKLAHASELERIKNDFNRSQKSNVSTINALRNSLRDKLTSSPALPEIASDTERTAEEWRDRYTAIAGQYATLESACRITTSDYNALRDHNDGLCAVYGCE